VVGLKTTIVSEAADPRASLTTLYAPSTAGCQTCRIDDVVQDRSG
jgi:hypothetical protein